VKQVVEHLDGLQARRWDVAEGFRTGWTVAGLMLDTCIWVARSDPTRGIVEENPAIERLMELYRDRRVSLAKADTVDVERTAGLDGSAVDQRILDTAGIIEAHGPFVLNHSRTEHSVTGSPNDISGIDDVLQKVHPGRTLSESSKAAMHDIRDALHIWTAIRYGYEAFVTTDGAVLKSANRLRDHGSSSIRIFTPKHAVTWVEGEIKKEESKAARRRALEEMQRP
jgi:hypothetical protein